MTHTPRKESYDQPRQHIGEGNGTPLQYSCLENPMDGGAWWAAVHGVTTFMVFPVVMYGCESWAVKKAEHRRIDAFVLWCWRRLLREIGRAHV